MDFMQMRNRIMIMRNENAITFDHIWGEGSRQRFDKECKRNLRQKQPRFQIAKLLRKVWNFS